MEPFNNCQATLTLHKSSHSLTFTFTRKYGISFKVAEFLASFDFMRPILNGAAVIERTTLFFSTMTTNSMIRQIGQLYIKPSSIKCLSFLVSEDFRPR